MKNVTAAVATRSIAETPVPRAFEARKQEITEKFSHLQDVLEPALRPGPPRPDGCEMAQSEILETMDWIVSRLDGLIERVSL